MCQHYRVKARCPQCLNVESGDNPSSAPSSAAGPVNPNGASKPGQGWRAGPYQGVPSDVAPSTVTGSKRSRESWEVGEDGKAKAGEGKVEAAAQLDADASLATEAWSVGPAGISAGDTERQVLLERAQRASADAEKELEAVRQQHALALAEIQR